ncbi:hypothetical protein Hanom_Chr11g01018111 [Helianthus anomalus]
MAADIRTQLILEQSRKRQRLNHAPKLLPKEQVEVQFTHFLHCIEKFQFC